MTSTSDDAGTTRFAQPLGVAGACAVVVGSLMPWANWTDGFESASQRGIAGHGGFTLVGGILIGVLIFMRQYVVCAVVAALTAAILAYNIFNVSDLFDDDPDRNALVQARIVEVAPGLYVATVGAIVALLAAAVLQQVSGAGSGAHAVHGESFVPLQAAPGDPLTPSGRDGSFVTRYDMSEWESDDLSMVTGLLTRNGIDYLWDGDDLLVGSDWESLVDDLLDQVGAGVEPPEH